LSRRLRLRALFGVAGGKRNDIGHHPFPDV
jgi:hypothetical protein